MPLAHHLHFITQEGLSIWTCQDGKPGCLHSFSSQEANGSGFSSWLNHHAQARHTLLVDLPEEEFQLEYLPPVSGQDRKQLIERRRQQQFFASPYTTAISLGRETTGRGDERVLLVGLTRPVTLSAWLEAFRTTEARLARIVSPALLIRKLIHLISPDAGQGMILSLSDAGIRQSFFEHGKLRFSRLSPAPEDDFPAWGLDCLREAQNTAQYLASLGCITPKTHLPVWIMSHREDFHAMMQDIAEAPDPKIPLEFRLAELDKLGEKVGFSTPGDNSDSLPLMIHLALRDRSFVQLAPAQALRADRLGKLRTVLLALGFSIGLGLSALAMYDYRETQALKEQEAELQARLETQRQHYQSLAHLPGQRPELEALRRTVHEHDALIAARPRPGETITQISRALDDFPDIRLKRLEWQVSLASLERAGQNTSFLLDASWQGKADDSLAIQATIEAFAKTLAKRAGGKSTLSARPFETAPDKPLHSEAISGLLEPIFQLRLDLPRARP